MKVIAAGLLVLLTACAGAPVSPEVQKLVPLIKAEKFDEAAANPDLLAPAFVEALREMKAEGSDPKRIVRVADFFFEHYPFSIKDLPPDEAIFEAVAEFHADALLKLEPRIDSCAALEDAGSLERLEDLLEGWHEPHADGGRCARRLYEIYRGARRINENLELMAGSLPSVTRDPWELDNLMNDLCRRGADSLGSSPLYVLTVLRASLLDRSTYQRRRRDAWFDYHELGSVARWKRLYWIRTAWLDSLRQQPSYEGEDAGAALASSRFDPRLRDLGRGLAKFSELMHRMDKTDAIESAACELIRAGRGTPFADLARYGVVVFYEGTERPDQAEAWLRSSLKEFDRPFRASYSLIEMTDHNTENRTSERNIELAREALNLDPKSSSAITALAVLGEEHLNAGREVEAIADFERALALGKPELGYFEDESADYARSDAGIKLAQLLQKREQWEKALAVWESVDYYSMCVLGGWDTPDTIRLSKATCLDRLGRLRLAAEAYWECVPRLGDDAKGAAKRLREIYKGWGLLPELRLKVDHLVLDYAHWKKSIKPDSGLQWLRDSLDEASK